MSEFNKFADLMKEGAYQENIKNLGKPMAELMKQSVIQLKPVIEIFFNKGMEIGKAQTVPNNSLSRLKNTITAHYDRINDVMHEEGYDDKSFGQLMALDFVEEAIDEMIEAQEPAND